MTTTIIIELNKLDADPKNVRKTYSADSISALAASIKVNGVLQTLSCGPLKRRAGIL
ncbi:ParB N-terminal domain-containing protein [Pararhizobium sp. YC-54]|nr:ParB N-terminal domain-containing protein [Pararhizobium sp. YC-54]MCW0001968.1 ParB N-terminal domain-containing protein [Pararhizobium sp. YC-54]